MRKTSPKKNPAGDVAPALPAPPKVLVATSVGRGKEYVYSFLWDTLAAFAPMGSYVTVFDGVEPPDGCSGSTLIPPPAPDDMGKVERIARVRNATRDYFLAGDWTHLYFHDADVLPPLDIIPRLLAHNSPIATGLCPLRGWGEIGVPLVSLPINGAQAEGSEMYGVRHFEGEVVACGMACCLIERSVLETTAFRQGEALGGTSEDFKFCEDARAQCGATIALDTTACCWHVDEGGTAGRLVVGERQRGAVYEDSTRFVSNKFGPWQRGVPRFDLAEEQLAQLGPGFAVGAFNVLSLETAPATEVVAKHLAP